MGIDSFITSFLAAFFTLFSPCILPVLPVYFSIISGFSYEDYHDIDSDKTKKRRLIANTIKGTIFFILGFSIIFILFGSILITFSQILRENRNLLKNISSIIIFLFGIFILFEDKLPIFSKEFKILKNKKFENGKIFSPFILGLSVSLGWTPCISPFLGTIILNASVKETAFKGFLMLISYCFSLLILFIIIGLIFAISIEKFKLISKKLGIIKVVSAILLMLTGILLFFNIL